ncbi:MAG: ABC transporter permease [Acidimicrobiales bacterium]
MLDPEQSGGGGANVVLRVADGVDVEAVVDDLRERLSAEVFVFEPIAPTDIVNFGRVESMPLVLGVILVAVAGGALVHLLLSAVRRRRRELAVLKTLGFVRRQVAGVVAAQATTVAIVGLVVGMPVGTALGRWAWTVLADSLGVVASPQVPLGVLAAIVAGVVVATNAIAFGPGQLAARTRPGAVLRAE